MTGSPFSDSLTGDPGINTLVGSGGNDSFGWSGGADTFDGGTGTNSVDFSADPSGIALDLTVAGPQAGADNVVARLDPERDRNPAERLAHGRRRHEHDQRRRRLGHDRRRR